MYVVMVLLEDGRVFGQTLTGVGVEKVMALADKLLDLPEVVEVAVLTNDGEAVRGDAPISPDHPAVKSHLN